MISISAPTFDLNGQVILQKTEESELYSQSRRLSKSKTLDGGVQIQDSGFSHGDRDFSVVSKGVTKDTFDAVSYLERNYPELMISIAEGLFLGAIENIDIQDGDLTISYLVSEKLTAEAI